MSGDDKLYKLIETAREYKMNNKIKAALLQEFEEKYYEQQIKLASTFEYANIKLNDAYKEIKHRIDEIEKFPDLLGLVTEAKGNVRIVMIESAFERNNALHLSFENQDLFRYNEIVINKGKYKVVLLVIPEK